MEKTQYPHSIRLNDEDQGMLDYLMTRLGMKNSQIFRLALRRLYQTEKKLDR